MKPQIEALTQLTTLISKRKKDTLKTIYLCKNVLNVHTSIGGPNDIKSF